MALPFAHEPGTFYEYAQTTVTVLGAVVEAAVGQDLQAFAQAELFGPLGIPRDRWSWQRDVAGHTIGFAALAMAPVDLARIGTLLAHDGQWGDRRLIDPGYVAAMGASSATNPGYGYLLWTNRGDSFITPSSLARRTKDRPWLPAAPRDLFALSGMFDQFVWVIPSLDMVVVRTGFFGPSNWGHEFFRILMRGVRDADIPDPGPLAGRVDRRPVRVGEPARPRHLARTAARVLTPDAKEAASGTPPRSLRPVPGGGRAESLQSDNFAHHAVILPVTGAVARKTRPFGLMKVGKSTQPGRSGASNGPLTQVLTRLWALSSQVECSESRSREQ